MTKKWSESFYNKWLRSQADLPPKRRNTLTISMQEPQALQSVLETILKYARSMNTGKAGPRAQVKWVDTGIELSVVDSKETF